jgi:hypothetical protein
MCCGQNRAAVAQKDLVSNQQVSPSGWVTRIRFTQRAPVLIRGPVTGRHYQFHEGAYSQQVDTKDAAVLLKSGYFQPD